MVQEKLNCYETKKNPDEYFQCTDKIEEIMSKNSKLLQQRFGNIDVNTFSLLKC